MGAKVPLMAAQANEANTAVDETPAKAAPLRALRLAFFDTQVIRLSVQESFLPLTVRI